MAFQNRLIVITGGAGGIARATAKPLVAEGADLLLIDPSAVMLDAAAVGYRLVEYEPLPSVSGYIAEFEAIGPRPEPAQIIPCRD